MKLIRCRDHGFDCDFKAEAKTEDEVLQAAAHHAVTVHGLTVTPALVEQVKASIQELPDAASSTAS